MENVKRITYQRMMKDKRGRKMEEEKNLLRNDNEKKFGLPSRD